MVLGVDAFAAALETILRDDGISGSELARRVGVSQSAVSKWLAGGAIEPENVFAVERALGKQGGELSRLMGYLPLDAVATLTPEDAIASDSTLSADTRGDLLAILERARARSRARAKSR